MKISHTCYFNVTHPFPFTVTNTRLASISDSYRFWNTVRKTLISSVYYAYCVYMHAACQAAETLLNWIQKDSTIYFLPHRPMQSPSRP